MFYANSPFADLKMPRLPFATLRITSLKQLVNIPIFGSVTEGFAPLYHDLFDSWVVGEDVHDLGNELIEWHGAAEFAAVAGVPLSGEWGWWSRSPRQPLDNPAAI